MKGSDLVLFACAGLMLSGGTILGGSSVFCLFRMSYYFWTTDLGIELGCGLLIVAGSVLCMPICWLCTVVPYHTKSTLLLGNLLVVTTASLTLLSLGMTSLTELSRATRDTAAVNASMLRAITHVHYDINVRNAFSAMQMELNCCGVNSFTDWRQYRRSLPASCCGRDLNGKKLEQCGLPVNDVGCLRPALSQLRSYSNSMAILASVVILVLTVILLTTSYTLAQGIMKASEVHPKPFLTSSTVQALQVASLPHSLLHGPAQTPARMAPTPPATSPTSPPLV